MTLKYCVATFALLSCPLDTGQRGHLPVATLMHMPPLPSTLPPFYYLLLPRV